MRAYIEQTYCIKITPDMHVWPWLVRHSAWLVERFHIKLNRRTAFQDLTDEQYKGQIAPFGETLLFRHATRARKQGELVL